MNESLRRRKAALHAEAACADALDQASELDGLPAMRLLLTDLTRILRRPVATRRSWPPGALALYPGHDSDVTTEEKS